MWNMLAVILWTGAFCRNVIWESVHDRRDISFSKRGIVKFSFRIVFTIRIVMRISCTLTFCTRWIGTSIFPLRGSPGGRGRLFSGTAHGSFYTARRPGGNWRRRANAHVLLSDTFLRLWHIPHLFPKSKFYCCSQGRLNLLRLFLTQRNWKRT